MEKLFDNVNIIDEANYYTTYYFLEYSHFLKALEKINASIKYNKRDFSVGTRLLDDFEEYFYITIHKW